MIPFGGVDNGVELAFEIGCEVGELLTTWIFLWVSHTNQRLLEIGWKSDFEKGYQCEKDYVWGEAYFLVYIIQHAYLFHAFV